MNLATVPAAIRHCFALVLVAAAACLLPMQASAAQTVQLQMQAHQGYFSERCMQLTAGQRLAYEVSTPQPIDFNLHHHPEAGGTEYPDRLWVESRHAKQILIASSGVYCFMAKNPATRPQAFEIKIEYGLSGG